MNASDQVVATVLPYPRWLAAGQHLRPPLPEQRQVPGQGAPAGLHVRGGLLQRQRQPAQLGRPAPGRLLSPDRRCGRPGNSAATSVSSTGTSSAWPGGQSGSGLVISTRPGPAGGRNGSTDARSGALSNISSHRRSKRGQHPVHRRHRIPRIHHLPGPELGRQLGEPRRQHRRILGRELPGHPDLGQVPVRVLHRHAGLARTAQPAQRHHPRPGIAAAGQPGIQLGQQLLPPGQEHRPRRQPHRLPRHLRAAARSGQCRHHPDYLGEHPLQPLTLQVGHVMVQLVRQRRQRAALGAAGRDLVHQVTGQRLGQQPARHPPQRHR